MSTVLKKGPPPCLWGLIIGAILLAVVLLFDCLWWSPGIGYWVAGMLNQKSVSTTEQVAIVVLTQTLATRGLFMSYSVAAIGFSWWLLITKNNKLLLDNFWKTFIFVLAQISLVISFLWSYYLQISITNYVWFYSVADPDTPASPTLPALYEQKIYLPEYFSFLLGITLIAVLFIWCHRESKDNNCNKGGTSC